jgi:hypothetical protein
MRWKDVILNLGISCAGRQEFEGKYKNIIL